MIYFIVGALSYALNWPALNTNSWLKLIATLVIFLADHDFAIWRYKNTAKIAKVGFFVGIVATGVILFLLGIIYIAQGNPIKVSFGAGAWMPDFTKINTLVVFVSFILAYAGVESSASHVKDMDNPGKNYPKAILILVAATILLDTLGGVTVAATIPQKSVIFRYRCDSSLFVFNPSFWRKRMAGAVHCSGHLFRGYC